MRSISSAKLRTRTGCLQCRKRRKKCDEARPQCAGCSRNELQCVWPSDEGAEDGRTRRTRPEQRTICSGHSDASSSSNSAILSPGLRPPVHMPSPFHREEHCHLYRYFGSKILPRLVRPNSLARYADQTYMLRLALEFPPLMGALISIAGMQLASLSSQSIHCAVQSYTQTLNGLRRALSQTTDIESNDALLATVITLSVFESFRLDTMLKIAPHVTASEILLRKRRARWINCPQASAVFDRICVESFVYHASLMMLFDPSLDSLSKPRFRLELSSYFSDPIHRPQHGHEQVMDSQPILHVSYEFFLLIADATKLARLSRPLIDVEIHTWKHLERQFLQWAQVTGNIEDVSAALYVVVLWILLLKSHPDLTPGEIDHEIGVCVKQGMDLLPQLDQTQYFTSFLAWPLAILGSVAVLPDERICVHTYLSFLIATSMGGQAAWVLKRLEKIWSVPSELDILLSRWRCEGFQVLLDGDERIAEHGVSPTLHYSDISTLSGRHSECHFVL